MRTKIISTNCKLLLLSLDLIYFNKSSEKFEPFIDGDKAKDENEEWMK